MGLRPALLAMCVRRPAVGHDRRARALGPRAGRARTDGLATRSTGQYDRTPSSPDARSVTQPNSDPSHACMSRPSCRLHRTGTTVAKSGQGRRRRRGGRRGRHGDSARDDHRIGPSSGHPPSTRSSRRSPSPVGDPRTRDDPARRCASRARAAKAPAHELDDGEAPGPALTTNAPGNSEGVGAEELCRGPQILRQCRGGVPAARAMGTRGGLVSQ
jgi:hypothetical protein